jgi:hypothetical protein
MNKKYIFKYKRRFFWRKIEVIGHKLEGETMVLYREDGGLLTIPRWHDCSLRLGVDWVLAVKDKMESESGTSIKLNVKTKSE